MPYCNKQFSMELLLFLKIDECESKGTLTCYLTLGSIDVEAPLRSGLRIR